MAAKNKRAVERWYCGDVVRVRLQDGKTFRAVVGLVKGNTVRVHTATSGHEYDLSDIELTLLERRAARNELDAIAIARNLARNV